MLEFHTGGIVLFRQFSSLDRQVLAQHPHLLHRLTNLLQSNVQMQLLLLQFVALFVVNLDKVIDQVQKLAGSNVNDPISTAEQARIGCLQRLVHVHKRVHHGLSVRRRVRCETADRRERVWRNVVATIQIHLKIS